MAWLLDAAVTILTGDGATHSLSAGRFNNMHTTTASGKCCCVQYQSQK